MEHRTGPTAIGPMEADVRESQQLKCAFRGNLLQGYLHTSEDRSPPEPHVGPCF